VPRGSRQRRQGQEIQRLLPELIRRELKDPRVSGVVTITTVELSQDLSQATVFVTALNEANTEEVLKGLNRASAFLRTVLAQRMRSRTVPSLRFEHDSSVERGIRLTRLIESAVGASSPDDPSSSDKR
jgi:ribosome-binding factor A